MFGGSLKHDLRAVKAAHRQVVNDVLVDAHPHPCRRGGVGGYVGKFNACIQHRAADVRAIAGGQRVAIGSHGQVRRGRLGGRGTGVGVMRFVEQAAVRKHLQCRPVQRGFVDAAAVLRPR